MSALDEVTEQEWDSLTSVRVTLGASNEDKKTTADSILKEAGDCLVNRAQDRDTQDERSMGKCVAAFNALYDKSLTVEQGWQFMVLLKMSRATVGGNLDDYVDQSAYSALAGEERMK